MKNNPVPGVTSFILKTSVKYDIPNSTLKLNMKILRELGLVELPDSALKITQSGKLVLKIMSKGGV